MIIVRRVVGLHVGTDAGADVFPHCHLGHENRRYASIKFFIFTQASGLLMLIAILALVFVHYRASGRLSFDYFDLLGTSMAASTELWIMLGFFIAFAVKLPVVPFHSWLPDAHTEAPTAGSVILAGVLLKTGAYGATISPSKLPLRRSTAESDGCMFTEG